jgi:hypothetical protein
VALPLGAVVRVFPLAMLSILAGLSHLDVRKGEIHISFQELD